MKKILLFSIISFASIACGEYKSDKTKFLEKQNEVLKAYSNYSADRERFEATGDTTGMQNILSLQYPGMMPMLDSMYRADHPAK